MCENYTRMANSPVFSVQKIPHNAVYVLFSALFILPALRFSNGKKTKDEE